MHDFLRPHRHVKRLTELDCTALAAQGLRGILLDLDNTLTAWKSTVISPEVARWIEQLRQVGLQACVVSNAATDARVRPVAEHLGLPWVTRAGKPFARGFQRGMYLMNTTPEQTAMIGDQVLTDIYGGNRLGLFTILVEPCSSREALVTRLVQRPLERLIGREAKTLSPSPR
jgi:HAD superfamily phosphatase (TIGR01668 family)